VRPGLSAGARSTFRRVVRDDETVPRLFPDARIMDDMPPVLASAYMIGLFEWACVEQVAPFYESGEGSLGIGFELTHVAPTPAGLSVTVETEVEAIDGRYLTFRVRGDDGAGTIGEGRHRRALVRWDRFAEKVEARRAQAQAGVT
jgi:fluoroacetyl-CoA thioesterase